jgi:hypothetical protein
MLGDLARWRLDFALDPKTGVAITAPAEMVHAKQQGRRLVARQPERCKSPDQARVRGLRASDTADGVVVFSVTGEPEFGEFEAPVVLARYGEIPQEFC